jgi:hypothetical protein
MKQLAGLGAESVTKKSIHLRILLPYVLLTFSVLITLFAIFVLSGWAEAMAWHHAAQHVTIFVSGVSSGALAVSTRLRKKDN